MKKMKHGEMLHIDPDRYPAGALEKVDTESGGSFAIPPAFKRKLLVAILAATSTFSAACSGGYKEPHKKGDEGRGGREVAENVKGFVGGFIPDSVKNTVEEWKQAQAEEAVINERLKETYEKERQLPAYSFYSAGPAAPEGAKEGPPYAAARWKPDKKNRMVMKLELPHEEGWTVWLTPPDLGVDEHLPIDVPEEAKNELMARWKAEFKAKKGREMKRSEEDSNWKKAHEALANDVRRKIAKARAGLGSSLEWDPSAPIQVGILYQDGTIMSYTDAPGVVKPEFAEFDRDMARKRIGRAAIRFLVTPEWEGKELEVSFIPQSAKDNWGIR